MILNKQFASIEKFFSRKFNVNRLFPDYTKSTLNVVSRLSIPTIEKGALGLIDRVFPKYKGKILPDTGLTVDDVKEADANEIDVYCRTKNFSDDLDWSRFYDTVYHLYNVLDMDNFQYYKIEDVQQSFDNLPKDSSSGFPYYLKKGDTKSVKYSLKCINIFKKLFYADQRFEYLFKHPTTVFHRYSSKIKSSGSNYYRNNVKVRQIFGVPQFICCLEYLYFYSFVLNFVQKLENVYVLYDTRVDTSNRISSLRDYCENNNKIILCGDIKSCDKSVSAIFHKIFFSFIVKNVKSESDRKSIMAIGKYLTYTPILSCLKTKRVSDGSTVSGAWTTSIFTTFTVFIAINYSFYMLYNRFPSPEEFLIQGDDFLIAIDNHDDFFSFKKSMKDLNLTIREDSCKMSNFNDEIEFLGFFWNLNNEPDQTDLWIISKILFPSKFIKFPGADRIISRYLTLLFQLSRFLSLYNRFLAFDYYLKEKVNKYSCPTFIIIDNRGDTHINAFPINTYLTYGWKLF